ncbi:MAG: oligosaccharide flippase family protein [Chitinophagaceae bacterium]
MEWFIYSFEQGHKISYFVESGIVETKLGIYINMDFKKELLKNIGFKGGNLFLSLVITIFISRLLGPLGNGIFSLFLANTAFISLIFSFSLSSGIIYLSAKKEIPRSSLFNTLVIIILLQVLFLLFAEVLSGRFHPFFIGINFQGFWIWGILFIASVLFNGYLQALFKGLKWFDSINAIMIGINLFFILVLGILLLQHETIGLTYTILFIKVFILVHLIQVIITSLVWLIKINYRFDFKILDFRQRRELMRFSWLAFFANVFQFLAYRMDFWLVDYFQGEKELGWYALAAKLSQIFWIIPIGAAGVIFPFSTQQVEKITLKMVSLIRVLLFSYFLLGLGVALSAPILIPAFFGSVFQGTVFPFLLLLPGVIIFSMTTLLSAYFAGINRLMINLKVSFFCFLLILIGDILLIPKLGISGAALVSSIGYGFSGIYSLVFFSRQLNIDIKEFIFIKRSDINHLCYLLTQLTRKKC